MSGQVPLVVTTFRNAPQCAMGPTSPAVEPNVPLVRRRDASPGWMMASDCCAQRQAVVSEEPHCPARTVAVRGCLTTTGEGWLLPHAYGSPVRGFPATARPLSGSGLREAFVIRQAQLLT